jgi:N-acetylglucosaminyldiphosphoundecaprenol N-acetyl-beta-D-mannosaminyltransferase
MESQLCAELLAVHNRSGLTVPDGNAAVWCARRAGFPDTERVYGPDSCLAVLDARRARLTSYFYGGREGVPSCSRSGCSEVPRAQVVGTESPPFGRYTPDERRGDRPQDQRDRSRPRLGRALHPKQER